MKAFLMHPDRNATAQLAPGRHVPPFVRDLALDTLWKAMAGDDDVLLAAARTAVLSSHENDVATILYRQDILTDCLKLPELGRELYACALAAAEARRKSYFRFVGRAAGSILYSGTALLGELVAILDRLRDIGDRYAGQCASRGFAALFATIREELGDEYRTTLAQHLATLQFPHGIRLSTGLGPGNGATEYILHQRSGMGTGWFDRVLGRLPPSYTFRIHERDEAGARALSELRNDGLNGVANAVGQATEHVGGFFEMLRTEVAFYVCCLNLHDRLAALGAPVCLPHPEPRGARVLRFSGLYDVGLALSMGRCLVGNAADCDGKSLVILTGANQGGKSSLLRGIGLAQLMMQCGMFVAGLSFSAECCSGVFTHFRREEDASMTHGKLDEELSRLSDLVDAMNPNALVLLNESFAATNEREGSEIARQVVFGLRARGVKVLFVTHLHEFAHDCAARELPDILFLRAERQADGTRTFRLTEGKPLDTSYALDVYRAVFAGYTAWSPSSSAIRSS